MREPPRAPAASFEPVVRDPEASAAAAHELQVVTEQVPEDAPGAGYDSIWGNIMRQVRSSLSQFVAALPCTRPAAQSAAQSSRWSLRWC